MFKKSLYSVRNSFKRSVIGALHFIFSDTPAKYTLQKIVIEDNVSIIYYSLINNHCFARSKLIDIISNDDFYISFTKKDMCVIKNYYFDQKFNRGLL